MFSRLTCSGLRWPVAPGRTSSGKAASTASVLLLLVPAVPQMLRCVSRTSLTTKLAPHLADQLTDIVTDAVLTIKQKDQPLDLYMVRHMHGQPAVGATAGSMAFVRQLVALCSSLQCVPFFGMVPLLMYSYCQSELQELVHQVAESTG